MGEKQKAGQDRTKSEFASLKKEKADLQKALSHNEAILNGLPAGFMVIQNGKIIDANEIVLNQTGYTARELLERNLRDLVPARLKTAVGEIYGKGRSGRKDCDPHEIELLGKNGAALSYDLNVRKIRLNNRSAFVVMFTLSEERKKREKKLAELLKSGAFRTMASGLVRALNNPTKEIRAGVRSSLKSTSPGRFEGGKGAEEAVREMERLGGALECLAKVVPEESCRIPFDLSKLVLEVLSTAHLRVEEQGKKTADIKVKTFLRSASPVAGDPEEVRQTLSHLVKNALDAMPGGGCLYVSTEENAGYAYIYIQDSGAGIPLQNMERVCDPFFTTKGSDNLGLGLSLSCAIIRRHRGEIEISSKENDGTMVTVKLPLAKREGENRKTSPRQKKIKNARILIIEDDPMIGELLHQTLQSKGCKVVVTVSAAEGLVQVRKRAFDMVIVGSAASEVNRESLVRRLKRGKRPLAVALIGDYTGGLDGGLAQLADLMISKPFEMSQTLERITEIIEQREKP